MMKIAIKNPSSIIEKFETILKTKFQLQNQPKSTEKTAINKLIAGYFTNTIQVKSKEQFRQLLKEYKILKELVHKKNWTKKDLEFIKTLDCTYGLEVQYIDHEDTKHSKNWGVCESFFEYCLKGLEKSREQLNIGSFKIPTDDILSQEQNFDNLLVYEGDPGYRKAESFWIKDSKDLLCTQATSWARAKKQSNYLDFYKCYRRQNTDKTHSCEFHQIEFNREYPSNVDPFELLIHDLSIILKNFDIDLSKLQIRRTRYPYVDLAIEIFYKLQDQMLEIAGAGIMKQQCMKDIENYNPSRYYGAFALGFERLYMIKTNKKTLNDVYETIKCDND